MKNQNNCKMLLFSFLFVSLCACSSAPVNDSSENANANGLQETDVAVNSGEKVEVENPEVENPKVENSDLTFENKLYEATAQKLIEAKNVSYDNIVGDNIAYDYFYICGAEGNDDIELYGVSGVQVPEKGTGYILRMDGNLYPVEMAVIPELPTDIYMQDYDEDGVEECAFVACAGRGTGYHVEKLIIIDPNAPQAVIEFGTENIFGAASNICDMINTEINAETNSVSFWLDDKGDKLDYGEIKLERQMSDSEQWLGVDFSDMLYIEYEDNEWTFCAVGGFKWNDIVMDYPEEGNLCLVGNIVYSNGEVKAQDIHLQVK